MKPDIKLNKSLIFLLFTLIVNANSNILNAESLTLEQANLRAIQNSPRVKILLSQYKSLRSRVLLNKSPYDLGLVLGTDYRDTDVLQLSIFPQTKLKQSDSFLSLAKSFTTGSKISLNTMVERTANNSAFNTSPKWYDTSVNLTVSQSLLQDFIGLPQMALIEADQMRLKATEYELWRGLEILMGDVARAYWNLWGSQQLKEVALDNKEESEEFLTETGKLSKFGLREKDEILQAEASVLEREKDLLTADTLILKSWVSLQQVMGTLGQSATAPPELIDPSWTPFTDLTALMSEAYKNRSDLTSVDMNLKSRDKIRQSLKGQLLPQLSASGGYSLMGLDPDLGNSIDEIKNWEHKGWNIGMKLSHSFGQSFDRSKIDQADAELFQFKAQYKSTVEQINKEIILGYDDFESTLKQLNISKQLEEKREKILVVFNQKFNQGRISTQDLLINQESLRQSRYRRRLLESEMAAAQVSLSLATGNYLSGLGFEFNNLFDYLGEPAHD